MFPGSSSQFRFPPYSLGSLGRAPAAFIGSCGVQMMVPVSCISIWCLWHLNRAWRPVRSCRNWGYPLRTAICSIGGEFSSRLFHLRSGVTSCVPVGSALHTPVPHDTTSMVPCFPDPEEDISGSHLLRHGVQLATSYPPFIDGGALWLSVIFIPG